MSETTLEDLENALGGAKVNRLLDQVTLIQKYLWEQTFALCLYSRSCYVGNDQTKAQDFAMRIRMANLLTHFEGSHDTLRTNLRGTALRVDLMEMLSGGQSCPTIAGAYRHDRLTHSDESAWELEEKLAEKAITFTKSEDKHPYTFEQMHISMCNPLALFQQLLLLSPPETFILERSESVITRYKKKIEEGDEKIRKKAFEELANAVLAAFERLSVDILVNPQSNDIHQHFQSKVRVGRDRSKLTITIDGSYLAAIRSIGEFDTFMRTLEGTVYEAEEIAEKNRSGSAQGDLRTTDYSNSSEVLEMMSSWQRKNGMRFFSGLDGCPKIIAYILFFDLEHSIGLFDKNLIKPHSKLNGITDTDKKTTKREQKVQAISGIVKDFLFDSSTDIRPGISDRVAKSITLNHIMGKWLPLEGDKDREERLLNLYKALYRDLPKKLMPEPGRGSLSPSERIAEQMKSKKEIPKTKLPIGSRIVMPFWSTFQSPQPSTTSEESVKG